MLDGEENKVVRVCVEEWFWSKAAFSLCNLVLEFLAPRWWSFLCFRCRAGGVHAELVPVVAVVMNEVGGFAEGLVGNNVLEQHDGSV
jgi:hypothetical protein